MPDPGGHSSARHLAFSLHELERGIDGGGWVQDRTPSVNRTGIVVFSFGQRKLEPGPCNAKLGEVAARAWQENADSVIVAQWETALQLQILGIPIARIVTPQPDKYLDSEAVWAQAREVFRENNVTSVAVIAQPFLHLMKVRKMIAIDGFEIESFAVGKIGFDRSQANLQPWTKSRLALLIYALRQALTGYSGAD